MVHDKYLYSIIVVNISFFNIRLCTNYNLIIFRKCLSDGPSLVIRNISCGDTSSLAKHQRIFYYLYLTLRD